MPPAVAAGALESVRYLREHSELREHHQERAATLKRRLMEIGIPVMPSVTHIVPVLVRDPVLCKQASDDLLYDHCIYVQPISTPPSTRYGAASLYTTPQHDDQLMDHLVDAMKSVWHQLGLREAHSLEHLPRAAALTIRPSHVLRRSVCCR